MNEPRAILTKRRLSSKVKDPDAALTSTTFTYQGQLKDANGPVTGAFDFQFVLYLAQAGGERLGASEMVDVVLTNGMFSFKLDFGRAAFEAKESWLEIGVRPSGGAEPYTVLFPRQKLTPTPYAIFAQHEQWGLIGVPVGFTDRAVIDKLTSVSTTEEVASKSSVEAQPTAKLEPPKEPSHAAEPAGGRMEITGTDDPLLLINHTGTSGSPAIWFQQDGATKAYLWWNKDTSRLNLGTPTTNPIMSLQDNGNVGIGTTTPASTLDIRTAQDGLRISGYQPFLTLTDTNSGRRGRIQSANGILGFQTEGDIANHLLSSVEIEDAPDAKTPRLLVRAQNGLETVGYQPFLTLSDSNAGYAHIRIQDVGGDMNFQTHSATTNPAGGSVMYIKDGTGNVGIGT
ncbi:MAG: hypothetical protein HY314_14240, partial [Acidobacteria bacterium]|nr:hypothetical protein [Acidobacteriota bacterium]